MNTQELIQQAVTCLSKNENIKGKELLQRAAEAGSAAAVLYYADILFKENKQVAYHYLEQQWHKGIRGTLHRRALLRCFFDVSAGHSATELFNDLHQEAEAGDVQSVIALITVMTRRDCISYYKKLLQQYSSELSKQLLSELNTDNVNTAVPAVDMLRESFAEGLQGWQKFNREEINADIELVVAKAALTEVECRYMMLRFKGLLQPSQIVDPVTGTAKHNPHRTGSVVAIVPEYLDWIALAIEWKMSAFANFPRQHGEVMNLIHYDVQQHYLPHFDAILGEATAISAQLRNGGQRELTVLGYLNTVRLGGETVFPKLGIKVKPELGDMLMFRSVDALGQLLQGSYHGGEPVQVGDKWVLSKWVRQAVTDYGTFTYG